LGALGYCTEVAGGGGRVVWREVEEVEEVEVEGNANDASTYSSIELLTKLISTCSDAVVRGEVRWSLSQFSSITFL
jgi:hypothetical protein